VFDFIWEDAIKSIHLGYLCNGIFETSLFRVSLVRVDDKSLALSGDILFAGAFIHLLKTCRNFINGKSL